MYYYDKKDIQQGSTTATGSSIGPIPSTAWTTSPTRDSPSAAPWSPQASSRTSGSRSPCRPTTPGLHPPPAMEACALRPQGQVRQHHHPEPRWFARRWRLQLPDHAGPEPATWCSARTAPSGRRDTLPTGPPRAPPSPCPTCTRATSSSGWSQPTMCSSPKIDRPLEMLRWPGHLHGIPNCGLRA